MLTFQMVKELLYWIQGPSAISWLSICIRNQIIKCLSSKNSLVVTKPQKVTCSKTKNSVYLHHHLCSGFAVNPQTQTHTKLEFHLGVLHPHKASSLECTASENLVPNIGGSLPLPVGGFFLICILSWANKREWRTRKCYNYQNLWDKWLRKSYK